jgi:transposase
MITFAKKLLNNYMSKVTKAKSHLSNDELTKRIKETTGFWKVQKWLIVYNAKNYPRVAEEIANHLAVSTSLVHKTISEYNRKGESSINTIGKGGRKNFHLTIAEEIKFMQKYQLMAEKGQISTANQIKEDFEKLVGKGVNKSVIYRLLERHNWRKIVPLPYHPKKDKEAQELFKKTSGMK